MRLAELSVEYQAQADALRGRIVALELQRRTEGDSVELTRRIRVLDTMRREASALAKLCAHYYERGYYRSERYTVCGIRRAKRTTI